MVGEHHGQVLAQLGGPQIEQIPERRHARSGESPVRRPWHRSLTCYRPPRAGRARPRPRGPGRGPGRRGAPGTGPVPARPRISRSMTLPPPSTLSPASTRPSSRVRRLTSRAPGNAASSMFAAMAMVEGPWFTGRSATPSRCAAAASRWMGLGIGQQQGQGLHLAPGRRDQLPGRAVRSRGAVLAPGGGRRRRWSRWRPRCRPGNRSKRQVIRSKGPIRRERRRSTEVDLAADLVVGVLGQRAVQLDLRLGQQGAVVDVGAEQGEQSPRARCRCRGWPG